MAHGSGTGQVSEPLAQRRPFPRSRRTPDPAVCGDLGGTLAAFLLWAVVGIAGCGPGDGRPPADPLPEAPERGLEEVYRLGGLEGPEEEAFSSEPPVAVDEDGLLYALHRDRGEIAVFDSAGEFERWIRGGRGEGPGEFRFPSRMGFVGDTLWVRNRTPPRISRFLRDGTHVGTDPVRVDPGYRTTAGVQGVSGYLEDGRAWLVPDGFLMAMGEPPEELAAPFLLGDRRMETRDTLFTWRAGRGRLAGVGFAPLPEPPFHHVAPNGSGVLVVEWTEGHPGEIELHRFSSRGTEVGAWTLPVSASSVPGAVRDSLVEAGRDRVREARRRALERGLSEESAPSVPTADEVEETAYLPSHFPPIRDALLGLDGTIWLQRAEGLAEGPWVALSPEGTPIFRVRLPPGVRLRQASRDAVWATTSDEVGVPYVVRWNVVNP